METENMKQRKTLGWREWIGLPELGIPRIKAKVDTGARTSCLHTFRVEPFQRDGADWVRFDVHPLQNNTAEVVRCEAPVKDQRLVRDSGGHQELRYVIQTVIEIGDEPVTAELTLTDRDTMKFRVLLGRTAVRGRCVVDPGRSFLLGRKRALGSRGTSTS